MNLLWSEHEKLAELIGEAVVQGNEAYDRRQLGLWAIEAIERAGYQLLPVGVGLPKDVFEPQIHLPVVSSDEAYVRWKQARVDEL